MDDRDDDSERETEHDDGGVPDLGASRSRGKSPAKRSKSSSRSRSESKSTSQSTTLDVAAILRAGAEAFSNGSAAGRHGFDGQQKAYVELFGLLQQAQQTIASQQAQLAAFAGQNPTIALLQTQAEKEKLETSERWKTIRDVAPKLLDVIGPNAVPLAGYLMRKFGILDPVQAPKDGDKSPRAAAARVLIKLADGSDDSTTMIAMLRGYVEEVCKEDFGLFLQFFKDGVTGAAEAEAET